MHSQRVGGTLVKIPKFTRLQVRFPRIGETWGKPIMYGLLMFTVSAYVLLINKYSSKYHKITKLNDFGTSHFQQTCNSSTIEWSGPFWGAVFQKNKNCARWLCRYNLHLSWLLELAAAPVFLIMWTVFNVYGSTVGPNVTSWIFGPSNILAQTSPSFLVHSLENLHVPCGRFQLDDLQRLSGIPGA